MMKKGMKIALGVALIVVILGATGIAGIFWHIQQSVLRNCATAQQAHPHSGDDVAALIDFMNSTNHSLWDRNHMAIWTLGHLGDPRALPALRSVYTGELCDHDKNLCQYELEKAIRLCGGTPNPPRKKKH